MLRGMLFDISLQRFGLKEFRHSSSGFGEKSGHLNLGRPRDLLFALYLYHSSNNKEPTKQINALQIEEIMHILAKY